MTELEEKYKDTLDSMIIEINRQLTEMSTTNEIPCPAWSDELYQLAIKLDKITHDCK